MTTLLNKTLAAIKPLDKNAMEKAAARQDILIKPQGALGRLEEISIRLAGIQRKAIPVIKNKAIITMAGDHGVVAEKVGNFPQEVTPQMVLNFVHGGAAINVISRQIGARVVVVNMGVAGDLPANIPVVNKLVARGTKNLARGPAMTEAQAIQSIEAGIEVVNSEIDKGLDIVGTGDMGIGNTTPSAAICAVMTGQSVAKVTGRGTGVSDEQLQHKIEVIERAIAVNKPDPKNGIDVLAKLGGFEIGGIAGVIIGAAARGVPVVVDGFISGAAALIAEAIAPQSREYMFLGHLSVEPGHKIMADKLGLKPIVTLDLRLGEGTGAAIGIFIAETSAKILAEMATFGEAGVSESKE
ncbi:nicotinate-nucleotide--dimethylbenzimidazole phosphoribosyltransferase [Dehalogenimonas etheniformans]|uniref:Nicotinate-nucleotide--dimethylbenzimidazole phosphoribosyltransferase n=1 Tax=Dehalogenimonas etheniformans TaxID=1536648 RepID=A0A2P5P9D9_9CHLR|nr:nicotinate-nucleotide--dimethylbenzimidazole phosphoribosyltransferase [Dehalogenimonas etheniformans]PPD58919.1 nicotinate-nucleotide--dimethylbenzimidazole phosphoribosyltransferase [Dehalogenimonas etheniformans]QNT76315.1 nicotinate-nucleotide--dimethylbenzimidazole phosphoribosyltransferase [Dehalogenimonas etheniformans]